MTASSTDMSILLLKLRAELGDARDNYTPNLPEDCGRYAAEAALGASIRFVLRAFPNGLDLVLPLRDLLDALGDLDKGHIGPMLMHRKRNGGRYITRRVETFRAMAAVLMEINMRGLGLDAAAEKAAKDLNERGYCDERGNELTAERIKDWRGTVMEGGDSLGANRFKDYVEKLSSVDEQLAREEVFRALNTIPGSRIPIDPLGYSETTG